MSAQAALDARYELQAVIDAGGMGVIHRGVDLHTGVTVAIKVAQHDASGARFDREIAALQQLEHPNVVRYLGRGHTPRGEPYLVMEWLEGTDLAARLRKSPLSIAETLELARQAAQALAFIHGAGVIHRDVKPRNLWLCETGAPFTLKLLDFGLSRLEGTSTISLVSAFLGTPEYMAPEQVRSSASVDASADVFSLGCVLHECLTGQPPFKSEHLVGTLAKILFDPTPQLRALRPDVPDALAVLIEAMLAKECRYRPADGAAVVQALASVRDVALQPARPHSFGDRERRMVSVVVLGSGLRADGATPAFATRTPGELEPALHELSRAHRGALELLADGTAIVSFADPAAPSDRARRAARCALAMRELTTQRPIGLVTGRNEPGSYALTGRAVERAASMFERAAQHDGVPIDELTGHLLDATFVVDEAEGQLYLRSESVEPGAHARTPFIGRASELGSLRLSWRAACAGAAQATLLIAPPGLGKSRLASELWRAVAADTPAARVWVGRGDPLRTDSALDVLRRMLRTVPEELARLLAPVESGTVARADAALHDAFVRFVEATTLEAPLLLVLEDVHWSDAASLQCIDTLLRNLPGARMMVLGLARPELSARFPGLFAKHGLQQLHLRPLLRGASEALVEGLLPERAASVDVARIVQLGSGNPFYLQELTRAALRGESALPETVLGMVEDHLREATAAQRRVLLAASVFGERFHGDGLAFLLRRELTPEQLAHALAALVESELIVPLPEASYRFRHALLREGAYAQLTSDDARVAHALAAHWLEQQGEVDAALLALHSWRGMELGRAGGYFLRAAQQAYRSGDMHACMALAKRGLECNVDDEQAARLHTLTIMAHGARGDYSTSLDYIADAKARASAPLPDEFALVGVMTASMQWTEVADPSEIVAKLDDVLDLSLSVGRLSTWATMVGWALTELDVMGLYALATPRFRRVRAALHALADEPTAVAWEAMIRCPREVLLRDAPTEALRLASSARAIFSVERDPFAFGVASAFVGYFSYLLGRHDEAIAAIDSTRDLDIGSLGSFRDKYLCLALCAAGRRDEANEILAKLKQLAPPRSPTDEGRLAVAQAVLAPTPELAEHAYALAIDKLGRAPAERAEALLELAELQRMRGQPATACQHQAAHIIEQLRAQGYAGSLVHRRAR